jgi:hypothetical protein
MKSEKGKPVFSDDVDAILTDKIVEHTKKNSSTRNRLESGPSPFPSSQTRICCMNESKSACRGIGISLALIIAGIVAFLIVKQKGGATKKRSPLGFLRK